MQTMHLKLILINLLFLLFLLNSCTREIEINRVETNPKLVLNCFLIAGEPVTAYVSHTLPVTSGSIPFVVDATVELWENNSFVTNLTPADSGIYKTAYIIREQSKYEVRVNKPGFDPISGMDSVPSSVQLQTAIAEYSKYKYADAGEILPLWSFEVTLTDNIASKNYYALNFIQMNPLFPDNPFRTFNNSYYSDIIISNEGYSGYFPDTYVFSDQLFDGMERTILMMMKDNECYYPTESLKTLSEGYYIVLFSTSKTYYTYMKSLVVHRFNLQMSTDTGEAIYKGFTVNIPD